jgi:tetratricopeptide (TPR) repeat protein
LQKIASYLQKEEPEVLIPDQEIIETIPISDRLDELQVTIPVMPEITPDKPVPLNIEPVTEHVVPNTGKYAITGKSKEYLIKGNAFFNEKKYAEAIDFFDISLQLESENCITWNNKGLALARDGKYDEALICYEKALQIDPDDYVYLNNKGNALYNKGDIKSAIKIFGLAFEKNPDNMTSIRGMELCIKSLKKTMK